MATYTGTADGSGNFNIGFGGNNYTSAQKVTVTATKSGNSKTVELFAPADTSGGGVIQFSGNLTNFPDNVGGVTVTGISGPIKTEAFAAYYNGHIWKKATSLTIGSGVTTIGATAFSAWSAATSLTIPNSVTTISDYAFNSWSAMTTLSLGTGLTTIGPSAFQNCTALTSITIPNSVTTIGLQAFYSCNAATSIQIGNGVTSIGGSAFYNATACNELRCLPTTPPSILVNTFTNLKSTCVIKVPAASLTAYQTAANWSALASKMVGV